MPFSSTQPSIKARVLPRFPANVIAGTGMVISKSGGTYTFSTTIVGLPLGSLQDITTDSLVGRDAAGNGPPTIITVGDGLVMNGANQLGMSLNQRLQTLTFQIASVTAGVKGDLVVPFACTINKVTLLGDANPTANPFILEIWKDTYANYPPVVGDSIVGTNKPTIPVGGTGGQPKSQQTTFATWTTLAIAAGDTLRFNVAAPAASTIARVAVCIDVVVT